ASLGAQVVWVMGNHDERGAYSQALFGEASDAPQDAVYDVNGLRIVSLDSTVPGYHHGELSAEQLAWLADVLADPAPHGPLLALSVEERRELLSRKDSPLDITGDL